MKSILIVLIGVVFIYGCSASSQRVIENAYGKTFIHTVKDNLPYEGKVLYRAAGDYYWVTDYKDGKFVIRKGYFINHDTGEHQVIQVWRKEF